eukprot:SAG31_NODE_3180_length_4582_cov_2.985501_7_plen_190_part_00
MLICRYLCQRIEYALSRGLPESASWSDIAAHDDAVRGNRHLAAAERKHGDAIASTDLEVESADGDEIVAGLDLNWHATEQELVRHVCSSSTKALDQLSMIDARLEEMRGTWVISQPLFLCRCSLANGSVLLILDCFIRSTCSVYFYFYFIFRVENAMHRSRCCKLRVDTTHCCRFVWPPTECILAAGCR